MKKLPTQMGILSSEEHREALLKIVNESHVLEILQEILKTLWVRLL